MATHQMGFMPMSLVLTEDKPQRWRALAILKNNTSRLLVLGQTHVQVLEHYDDSYFDSNLFDDEERAEIKEIQLQKWFGMPDRGKWLTQRNLDIPEQVALKIDKKKITA